MKEGVPGVITNRGAYCCGRTQWRKVPILQGVHFTFGDPSLLLKREHRPAVMGTTANFCPSTPAVFATLFQDSGVNPSGRIREKL